MNENAQYRNRHPVDQLAEVRAQIRTLQEEEETLRAKVLDGECGLAGDDYVAIVQTRPQNKVDMQALRKAFGAALKPYLVAREVTQVWLKVRSGGGVETMKERRKDNGLDRDLPKGGSQ
jgi:hypothetical protein